MKITANHQPIVEADTQRIGMLVLGMHRSGTSALSRVLSLLGCDLPKTLMEGREDNETGHWESDALCSVNDEILASAGSNWFDWLPFNPGWYDSPKMEDYKDRALAVLEEEFGASRLLVLKDPRICRFAPFWIDVLKSAGIQPAIIMPLRNPLEVGASLEKRDGFDPALSHLLWLRHVLDAEAATRGMARFHCSYEGLMEGWSSLATRAQKTLGISWPRFSALVSEEISAFLTDRHRHHREKPRGIIENPLLSAWLRDAYEIFNRWTEEGENSEDYPALDQIRAEFDAAAPAFASLIFSGLQREQEARELERVQHQAEAAETASHLAEARKQLAELEKFSSEQSERAKLLEKELDEQRKKLAERFGEIAALTNLMREKEALAQGLATQLAWLRDAAAILLGASRSRKGRWRALLPAIFLQARQAKQFERNGLFDGKAYLAANPDVESQGIDPLRHYIRQGVKEGRSLGIEGK